MCRPSVGLTFQFAEELGLGAGASSDHYAVCEVSLKPHTQHHRWVQLEALGRWPQMVMMLRSNGRAATHGASFFSQATLQNGHDAKLSCWLHSTGTHAARTHTCLLAHAVHIVL